MAGKRGASNDLNHTNWDNEEEPEDAGSFKVASETVLQKRVFKTAKRRNPASSTSTADSDNKAVFSSFKGFTKPATSATFGFLKDLTRTEEPSENGQDNNIGIFKQSNVTNSPMFKIPEIKAQNTEKDDEYYAKLKGLNESVSNWIKKHVDNNPFVNLKPIFKDYERYFDELEKLHTDKALDEKNRTQLNSSTAKSSTSEVLPSSSKSELSSFSFKSPTDTEIVTSGLSTTTTTVLTSSAPTFSFGSNANTASGFSFDGANKTPFLFTNVSTPNNEGDKETEDNGEDEPPEVEFTPVVEDGHIYTIRCKVFVKKDGNFSDRGVGNLYLKPVSTSDKVQLIVRADTNLGNLLCNFILSEGIPTKRMGKKDVMLVCLPTPDSKPPPVPILLRVKSTEDADELLKVLDKHKK